MIKKFIAFYIILLLLLAFLFAYLYKLDMDAFHEVLDEREKISLEAVQFKVFTRSLNDVVSDLLLISELHELKNFIEQENTSLSELEKDYVQFLHKRGVYDQVRFIDSKGMEVIRVNYNNGHPNSVSRSDLQDKSSRYYFTEAIKLSKGEIFISPLELNFEKGKIETPQKPMLHLATPIFNHEGEKEGIIILNFLANSFLKQFKSSSKKTDRKVFMTNMQGYFLASSNPDEEWGFMREEGKANTLHNLYPRIARLMSGKKFGQFHSNGQIVTFATVSPSHEIEDVISARSSVDHLSLGSDKFIPIRVKTLGDKGLYWRIAFVMHSEAMEAKTGAIKKRLFGLYLFFASIFGIATWYITRLYGLRQKDNELLKESNATLEEKVRARTKELTEMNAALNQSREEALLLLQSTGEGIYGLNLELECTIINQSCLDMLGYHKKEEFYGKNMHLLMHHTREDGSDYPVEECRIQKTLNKGEGVHVEDEVFWRKDNSSFPVEYWSYPIKRDGELIGAVVTFVDISERKQMERFLKEEKEFNSLSLNSQKDTFFVFNPATGKAQRWNRAFNEVSGYTDEEISEMKAPDSYYSEEDLQKAVETLGHATEKGEAIVELELICKDGSIVPTEYVVNFFSDKKSGIEYVLSIGRDITERRNWEIKLQEINEGLERKVEEETKKRLVHEALLQQQAKMAAMGEMLSAISHQWRQPLNSLGLVIQDIRDAYDFGEMDSKYIDEMIKNSMGQIQFMSKTIDDFRDFFKPSKEEVSFDVEESINAAISLVATKAEHHGITFKTDFEKGAPFTLKGHPNDFKQVLLNLLNNAIDAVMEALGAEMIDAGNAPITVRSYREEGYILIDIENVGIEIKPKDLSRIFEPYFTTKEEGKGTGIGLYMSHMIIKNMGGEITATNISGGVCFTIKF